MRDDIGCEHSEFCYVNYQGWHHTPGCPRHHETLERERSKATSARAEPRKPKVSLADIAEKFREHGGGL